MDKCKKEWINQQVHLMNKWMNEWRNKWIDKWINEWMNERKYEWTKNFLCCYPLYYNEWREEEEAKESFFNLFNEPLRR